MNLSLTVNNKYLRLLYKKECWIIIICIGFICKLFFFPFRSGDYNFYLKPWIDFIIENKYLNSLEYGFYNYTPSYIYILTLIAKIGLNPLYSIKIVSIIFEYILAFFIGKIAFMKLKDPLAIWISLAVIPLIPTVFINGAFWGQCDAIYSAFVVGSFYFFLNKRNFLSVFFLGIAFAFKLQVAFILPLYFVALIRGGIKWQYFLIIPLIYFVSIIPAWLYGRSLIDLLRIYIEQSNYDKMLTVFFPNLYVWIDNNHFNEIKLIGIIFTALFVLIIGFLLGNKKYHFTYDRWIELAFLSVIIIPFLLPGMRERYLFLGDVLVFLYVVVLRKNKYYFIGIISVSLYAYLCCSRLKAILPVWPAFFLYLSIIIFAVKEFLKSLCKSDSETTLSNNKS